MTSGEWLAWAKRLIPTGASTLSKRSRAYVEGSSPVAYREAVGAYLIDVEQRQYLDWTMALGPAVLGYAHPRLVDAIGYALRRGAQASLPHESEPAVAERLIDASPYVGTTAQVRFLNSGTEACLGAIRAARRFTGHHWVLSSGYHGWSESFMCLQAVTDGIPVEYSRMVRSFEWGDVAALECAIAALADDPRGIAAVILEPIIYDLAPPGYLHGVADLAHDAGALLVADEVVTGFRVRPGVVMQNAVPDLTIYGKALSGPWPFGCVVGRADVIAKADAISGTYAGSAPALAAVNVTLDWYADHDVYGHIERIGEQLRGVINDAAVAAGLPLRCEGIPARMHLTWPGDDDYVERSKVVELLAERRITLNQKAILPSWAHEFQDVRYTGVAMAEACQYIAAGYQLRGLPIQPAFARDPQKAKVAA